MNTIPQNQVYFGANLRTGLKTPEVRRIMQAADKFCEKTSKNFPKENMHIRGGEPLFDCPVLFLDKEADLMHGVPIEFLGINAETTQDKLAAKLVKAFKILLEDRKLWLADWRKNENIAQQSVKRMEKIAGKDAGLQEYVGAIKTGFGIDA